VSDRLEDLISLERECCSDITFDRRESAKPGRIRLEIHGIDTESQLVQVLGVLEPTNVGQLTRSDRGFSILVSHAPARGMSPEGATITSYDTRAEPRQGHYCIRFVMKTVDRTSRQYPTKSFLLEIPRPLLSAS